MYISKTTENTYPHKYLYMNVHGSIIHASKEVETSQMFINCLREKQNLIYGILFGSKQITDISHNVPVTKKHIMCDFLQVKW